MGAEFLVETVRNFVISAVCHVISRVGFHNRMSGVHQYHRCAVHGRRIRRALICTPRQMPWRFDSLHNVSGAHKCRLDAFDRFRAGDAFSGDGVEAKARGEGRQ